MLPKTSEVTAKDLFFNDIESLIQWHIEKPQFNGANMSIDNLNTSFGNHIVQKILQSLLKVKKLNHKKLILSHYMKIHEIY